MRDDANSIPPENNPSAEELQRYEEYRVDFENVSVSEENPAYREFGSIEKTVTVSPHKQVDMVRMASTFAVVALVACSVVLSDSPFSSVFDPFTGVIADVFGIDDGDDGYDGHVTLECTPGTDTLWYQVSFEKPTELEKRLTIRNTNTDRSYTLSGDTSGAAEKLRAGMTYVVSVVVGEHTMVSRSVTMPTHFYETPVFSFLYAECKCLEDGFFHFRFDLKDRSGACSDFAAKLSYNSGGDDVCTFTGDVTDEQKIPVDHSKIQEMTATLVITWTEAAEDGSTSQKTYQTTVNI